MPLFIELTIFVEEIEEFVDELDKLCKKHANEGKDYYFNYKEDG